MLQKLTLAFPLLALWIAVAALATLVISELGWARVRRHSLTLLLLILALLSLPAGAVYKLSRPYQTRIMAILLRRKSQSIADSGSNGCTIFPANNIWNTRVNNLPVDPRSAAYIETMGPNTPLHPDFGATGGIPYMVTDGGVPPAQVNFEGGGGESDPNPYYIPDNAPNEGGGDAHVVVLDRSTCKLYEVFAATRTGPQQWTGGSGAIFDLKSNALRPYGWTSSDAAGLPILAGLARYEEVAAGKITHALRFSTRLTRREFVWPGRHFASNSNDPNRPPLGQRFRLRSSFDTSGFSHDTQIILAALKEYGMMLSDNGGDWYITGSPDVRWSSSVVTDFKKIAGSNFEAVDVSGLMVNRDSGEAKQ